jgi:LacI family gluconate utilization system Gnt-I transcriptional repressor
MMSARPPVSAPLPYPAPQYAGRVSPALRDKILQVVEQLGYVPNRSARQLASARSRTVLVLIPSLSNTVFIDALAGIEAVLQAAGYQMLIGNTHYSSDEELALLRLSAAQPGWPAGDP